MDKMQSFDFIRPFSSDIGTRNIFLTFRVGGNLDTKLAATSHVSSCDGGTH